MEEVARKYAKGTVINFGNNKATVVSDLMKFKDFYAIYADITENVDSNMVCGSYKLHEKLALIIRNKEKMMDMGLTTGERRAIYCHELGHCFSSNQGQNKKSVRNIDDEVDSDTFAVKQCDVPPRVLKSVLKKSYEYEIAHIDSKKDLTQERYDRYVAEMRARKANALRLIAELDAQSI